MSQRPIAVFSMPDRSHFQRLRPLVSALVAESVPVSVFTDRRFQADVELAGGTFVDLFTKYPLDTADSESMPMPSRLVTYAGHYADRIAAVDDFNPFRGNQFKKLHKNENGEYERDSLGRVKYVNVTDEEAKGRRNYQRGNVINYMDGDSASMVMYGYAKTTLISDKSRVYKGGSWNDRPYWLSPGTRRHLEEDQASAMVGFRCAMDRVGSQEGNGFKNGQHFGKRRQNTRKQ